MKPSEVGFDGTIQIYNGTSSPYKIIFARSTHDDKGPELFYRNKDGKLFTVNFEPWENQ